MTYRTFFHIEISVKVLFKSHKKIKCGFQILICTIYSSGHKSLLYSVHVFIDFEIITELALYTNDLSHFIPTTLIAILLNISLNSLKCI